MRFEKWQALGNDYLIVERAALPVELTPARVRLLCSPHFGPGGDGVLELGPPDEPGFVARLRIFNPTGRRPSSRATAPARRSSTCGGRAGRRRTRSRSRPPPGEIRPTITSATTCRVDMGRATLRSPAYPSGGPDGDGIVRSGGRDWRFQHVSIGNPQCAIRVGDAAELDGLDLPALGPAIENAEQFPRRTNVSFWTQVAPGRIRARIFERGVGETMSSGTGASGAAVASVLRGGDSPVTVVLDGGELTVDVGEDLHVDLTGWAEPVYRAELAAETVARLVDTV
jgi:diaminopimelate epimerase